MIIIPRLPFGEANAIARAAAAQPDGGHGDVTVVERYGITVVLGGSAATDAAGDFIYLRAQPPTYTLITPFLWANTQYRFATTAAGAGLEPALRHYISALVLLFGRAGRGRNQIQLVERYLGERR